MEKSYERVARIDKKMEVKKIAKTLTEQGSSYLGHNLVPRGILKN